MKVELDMEQVQVLIDKLANEREREIREALAKTERKCRDGCVTCRGEPILECEFTGVCGEWGCDIACPECEYDDPKYAAYLRRYLFWGRGRSR